MAPVSTNNPDGTYASSGYLRLFTGRDRERNERLSRGWPERPALLLDRMEIRGLLERSMHLDLENETALQGTEVITTN